MLSAYLPVPFTPRESLAQASFAKVAVSWSTCIEAKRRFMIVCPRRMAAVKEGRNMSAVGVMTCL